MRPLVNGLYFFQFAAVDGTNLLYQIVKVFLHLSSSPVVYDVLLARELLFVLLKLLRVYLHLYITLWLFFAALLGFSNSSGELLHNLCATHVCIIYVHVPEFPPI
jgi:hypothetical protein